MSPQQFQQQLLSWFDQHGRHDLPWQQNINPYRVWVSEIMLQQTQVASVIGYYQRFMQRFPTLTALAEADIDSVLQHWAGLGYYARARNLHKSAQCLVKQGGVFPDTIEGLCALPGIGRSTAGAILSIACGQSQPILDGNVKRVLARFHAIEGWPGNSSVAAELWQLATEYTPADRAAAYAQAMMDLGATLCTRSKPNCPACPVAAGCVAYRDGKVSQFPQAKPRKQLPIKQRYWLILIDSQQRCLLERRPPSGIWGGLWALPEFDQLDALQQWCAQQGWSVQSIQMQATQQHRFSHFQLDYIPVLAELANNPHQVMASDERVWYNHQQIETLALPTPVQRLLQSFQPFKR